MTSTRSVLGKPLGILIVTLISGCSSHQAAVHPLDEALARESVQIAMQAWADGRSPEDLRPEIVVGDTAWEQGQPLVSFQILPEAETTDGSNLHIRVRRQLNSSESTVTYIVGTTPVVTIFPQ